MKKIGDITATADQNGEFTNGNVAAGVPPTLLESAWFNSVQREIINVLVAAGVPQNKDKDDQLSEAIKKLAKAAVPDVSDATTDKKGIVQLDDVISDSKTKVPPSALVKTALENLGKGKVDYGNHTVTGGVDAAGNGSVNAAGGGIRFYRKKDGTLTLYSREAPDGESAYVSEVSLPRGKGGACIDTFTFAAGGVKYRDVKSQRKNGVTYTNTLPRPIFVIVSYDSPATRTLAYVDGVRVAQTSHGSPSQTGAWGGYVSFPVPAGSKYIVNSNGDKVELMDWVEL